MLGYPGRFPPRLCWGFEGGAGRWHLVPTVVAALPACPLAGFGDFPAGRMLREYAIPEHSPAFSILLRTVIIQPPMKHSSLLGNKVLVSGLERLRITPQLSQVFNVSPVWQGLYSRGGNGSTHHAATTKPGWENPCSRSKQRATGSKKQAE